MSNPAISTLNQELSSLEPTVQWARVYNPLRVSNESMLAADYVSDVVIGGIPKAGKKDLGNGSAFADTRYPGKQDTDFGGLECQSGQDCVGARLFDGSLLLAVLTASDGISTADREASAMVARKSVETTLRTVSGPIAQSTTHANSPNLLSRGQNLRDYVLSEVERSIPFISKKVNIEAPGGAATLVTAAVVVDYDQDNRPQLYIVGAATGDSQVILLSTDPTGNPTMHKLIIPQDAVFDNDPSIQRSDDNTPLEVIWRQRNQSYANAKANIMGIGASSSEAEEYLSPIAGYVGEREGKPPVTTFKHNLSSEYFKNGHSNVTMLVCSDNVGEKVPEAVVIDSYRRANGENGLFAENLGAYMKSTDADDGSFAIASLGKVPSQ